MAEKFYVTSCVFSYLKVEVQRDESARHFHWCHILSKKTKIDSENLAIKTVFAYNNTDKKTQNWKPIIPRVL